MPTLRPIKGNAGKLQQVFLNLFLNARDAMEARRRARNCDTYRATAGALVEVIDTGHGIAPEHLHRIYDPFFTTKGARKGHGARAFGDLRDHSGARRTRLKLSAGPAGDMFPSGISLVETAARARIRGNR